MDHPDNFRHPQSMRLWPTGGAFFCYAPVQMSEFSIEPGKPYISTYRFWVHEGEVDAAEAERRWLDFAHPPRAQLELN
jgi:hypothetical protein